MDRSLSTGLLTLAAAFAALSFPARVPAQDKAMPSVRHVQVLRTQGAVEIEIEGSDRLVPRPQVLTGPDRLVVDFPYAVPGSQLRNQTVNRGEVKTVRVGLFATNPPVTRVVVDLSGPQSYQIFPSGRTVMIKVGSGADATSAVLDSTRQPGLVNMSYPAQPVRASAPSAQPRPPLQVLFQGGDLTIHSDKASLSEVLFAVHERTGADIAIPAGAEQEKVAAELGPGPAAEVLSTLLNGSRFNFLILSAEGNPRSLDRVILSPRADGGVGTQFASMPLRQMTPAQDDADDDSPPPSQPSAESIQPATPPGPPPGRQVPNNPPDTRPQENTDAPD